MSLNQMLPFVSTAIMLGFTMWVLQRWLVGAPHFLFWGIGLAFFAVGSFAEAYPGPGWNRWVFFGGTVRRGPDCGLDRSRHDDAARTQTLGPRRHGAR